MTLSRFLRDYLYIPLGGGRRGPFRRYLNLMITMVLGGLWHGAGFTFILWGALHGALLALNHLWRAATSWQMPKVLALPITLLAVILTWVPFRAADMAVTGAFYRAMSGVDGVALPASYKFVVDLLGPLATTFGIHVGSVLNFDGFKQLALLPVGFALVVATPNLVGLVTQPASRRWLMKSRLAAAATGFMFTASLVAMYVRENVTFLYFQF